MTEITEKEETEIAKDEKAYFYACTVDAHLYEKLDRHVFALKSLEGRVTKQSWITQAINEKLKSESFSHDVAKEKRLGFLIEKKALAEIEKRVELLKNFRTSYSKKQWLIEAFYEKLDRDTKLVQEGIEKIKSNI